MRKAFGIAGGAQALARNVLVEVTLENGVIGLGEAAPLPPFNGETQEDALAALASVDLVGHDVAEWKALGERLSTLASASAACALETAAIDALTRVRGISLRDFFGGAESTLVTDITITTGTVEEAAREALEFRAFRTLKTKVGGADVALDVARIIAIKKARPDARLMIDANAGYSLEEALHLIDELRRHDALPDLFEQPIRGPIEAIAEVRAKGVPVALDESITKPADVVAAHRAGACDAVNVKIMKSGIARAAEIVAEARRCGLRTMIGGMVETRLAMSASACLAAGLGGFSIVDLDTPLFLAEDPFTGGLRYDGDQIDLTAIKLGHGCNRS